jgi:hypothetical protein
MPASLMSSRLPNLPRRMRTSRRTPTTAMTTDSSTATATLSQNSQTKCRS